MVYLLDAECDPPPTTVRWICSPVKNQDDPPSTLLVGYLFCRGRAQLAGVTVFASLDPRSRLSLTVDLDDHDHPTRIPVLRVKRRGRRTYRNGNE